MRKYIFLRALTAALSLAAIHCSSDPATPPSNGSGGSGGGGGAGGGGMVCDAPPATAPVDIFTRHTVDASAAGPAYASAADIDGDGRKDLVVTRIGPALSNGQITLSKAVVSVYLRGDGLDCWQKVDVITEADDLYFPGQPTVDDIDGDGDLDIALAFGFFVCQFDPKAGGPCGAMLWLEQTASGFTRHDIIPDGDSAFYHRAELVDFDGDGTKDLLTVGETQSTGGKVFWFKGDGSADRFEKVKREIGDGGGSFPQSFDVDGDGDLDVVSAEFFGAAPVFTWFERTAEPSAASPAGVFVKHVVNDDSGRGIKLEIVPNLYGDGKAVAVATNHVNTANMPPDPVDSAVLGFDIPADPTMPWPKTVLSSGIVSRPDEGLSVRDAPGIFGHGDVDGDGDIDIVVSGDGDARTYWMEQTGKGTFAMHVIEQSLGQAGGCVVDDLDGDGKNELVFTGYEDNAVYVYERK